jgi:hypothetical protein
MLGSGTQEIKGHRDSRNRSGRARGRAPRARAFDFFNQWMKRLENRKELKKTIKRIERVERKKKAEKAVRL